MADNRPRDLRARPRTHRGTVRLRTTLAAVLVAGLALILGAVVIVVILREMLAEEVVNGAMMRGSDVAAMFATGTQPVALPVSDVDDELVQVLDARGTVIASSDNVAGQPPVARPRHGEAVQIPSRIGAHDLVAVAVPVVMPEGSLTVLVARTLEPVADSTELVAWELGLGLPVLLLIIGTSTWLLVGRALAPIEAMRREVDEISATELHRRVPDPPGSDEVARLAATMNRMLDGLERAHNRQQRFVADASHELRTPVAAIRQHIEVALAHPERSNPTQLAETVLAAALLIQRLIEDLLLLARVDEHGLALRREPIDLDDLVFEEADRLRGITDRRIDTTGVCAARIDGDARWLRRILANLGENAARHATSCVWFGLNEQDDRLVLTVDDDGRGIAVADRERVMERFVRLDAARARDSGGSGLGLAIVAELVDAHDGTVAIEDAPHGGTRVRLSFPRTTERSHRKH